MAFTTIIIDEGNYVRVEQNGMPTLFPKNTLVYDDAINNQIGLLYNNQRFPYNFSEVDLANCVPAITAANSTDLVLALGSFFFNSPSGTVAWADITGANPKDNTALSDTLDAYFLLASPTPQVVPGETEFSGYTLFSANTVDMQPEFYNLDSDIATISANEVSNVVANRWELSKPTNSGLLRIELSNIGHDRMYFAGDYLEKSFETPNTTSLLRYWDLNESANEVTKTATGTMTVNAYGNMYINSPYLEVNGTGSALKLGAGLGQEFELIALGNQGQRGGTIQTEGQLVLETTGTTANDYIVINQAVFRKGLRPLVALIPSPANAAELKVNEVITALAGTGYNMLRVA